MCPTARGATRTHCWEGRRLTSVSGSILTAAAIVLCAAVGGCTSSHGGDLLDASTSLPDASTAVAAFCMKDGLCESCATDPVVCEQCDLTGGVCVAACGGAALACPHADAGRVELTDAGPGPVSCGAPLAPCTTPVADGQVCIAGSTMFRGSDDPDYGLSAPRRMFYVSAFWLDVDEVTVTRYRACVTAGACTEPADPMMAAYLRDPANDTLPMRGVSFVQAVAFCSAGGGRLPTETEWERAASGADGRPFPWGTEVGCDRANWGYCTSGLTPVGSYPLGRSPEGVNDLIGNVWELTSDRIEVYLPHADYTAFDPEPPCDPTHPAREGIDRFVAIRGSSAMSGASTNAELLRLAAPRRGRSLFEGGGEIGFRCARDGA